MPSGKINTFFANFEFDSPDFFGVRNLIVIVLMQPQQYPNLKLVSVTPENVARNCNS
jgi:hypothetical protein